MVEGYTVTGYTEGQTGDTQIETEGHRATYAWGPESGVVRPKHDKLTYTFSYSLVDVRALSSHLTWVA